MRVLIVDGDRSAREHGALALRARGVRTDAAANCKDAFVHLATRRYDAVCLDGHLADGTGLEILKVVRAHYPQTRAVMATRHARDPVFRMRAEELGAEAVFDKPLASEAFDTICPSGAVRAVAREKETPGRRLLPAGRFQACGLKRVA